MKKSHLWLTSAVTTVLAGILALPAPVQASLVSLDILNASFESADMTVWSEITSPTGDNSFGRRDASLRFSPTTAQDGMWFVSGRADGATSPTDQAYETGLFQELVIGDEYGAAIDAGTATTSFRGYGYGEGRAPTSSSYDYAFLRIAFRDALGGSLGGVVESNIADKKEVWTQLDILDALVPIGTREIVLNLIGQRGSAGGNFDVGFDNISGSLNVLSTPLPAAVWLFASAVGLLGWVGHRRRAID